MAVPKPLQVHIHPAVSIGILLGVAVYVIVAIGVLPVLLGLFSAMFAVGISGVPLGRL
ncbi:MAG: hypothetical protein Q7S23_04980 [bacterium]|nr:hypothetical protein [bacterium]